MMKKIRKLVLIFAILILTSCSSDSPQDVTDLIVQPEAEEPILKGTWEVYDIKNTDNSSNPQSYKVGDLLYIDKDLVAINNDYALPPKFTSKYVNITKYLDSRGIDLKTSSKADVVVLNASQGQLYSKDFVIINKNTILFVNDNKIILLKRKSPNVEKKVLEKYQAKSEAERSFTIEGEAVEVDINIYIGVRERVESYGKDPSYYYYTYSVRIEPNKPARIYKTKDIYFPKKDEFWRFKAIKNDNNGKYDSLMAYPVRLDKNINSKDNQEKYTFTDHDKDMRFNFVNENFISFDYSSKSNNLPINKYAMVKIDELDKNSLMDISDYTGDKESNKNLEDVIYDEVSKNFADVKKDDIIYDFTNFGIIRNQGLWTFQTSYLINKDDSIQQKSFPIDLAIRDDLIIGTKKNLNVDQVKNINSQEKDYFELINDQYVAIQTADELIFYKIKNGYIEINPSFYIPFNNPTQVIMFEQGLGSYADKWEKSFIENNDIIR
ncbi:MAG: hypothetical protein PUG67_06255 [Peptoniphilaceae bacterium]|nr:hypothetical protein [Peptoniphilaceae bacterium]MDY6018659.1 hypothetical protein [Anaerococcus sp.]